MDPSSAPLAIMSLDILGANTSTRPFEGASLGVLTVYFVGEIVIQEIGHHV